MYVAVRVVRRCFSQIAVQTSYLLKPNSNRRILHALPGSGLPARFSTGRLLHVCTVCLHIHVLQQQYSGYEVDQRRSINDFTFPKGFPRFSLFITFRTIPTPRSRLVHATRARHSLLLEGNGTSPFMFCISLHAIHGEKRPTTICYASTVAHVRTKITHARASSLLDSQFGEMVQIAGEPVILLQIAGAVVGAFGSDNTRAMFRTRRTTDEPDSLWFQHR